MSKSIACFIRSGLMLLAALVGTSAAVRAQSDPLYVPLPDGAKAALYRPDNNPNPTLGFLIIHRVSNVMNHLGCTELSKRGFAVLCVNPRFENNESLVDWEKLPLDMKPGME